MPLENKHISLEEQELKMSISFWIILINAVSQWVGLLAIEIPLCSRFTGLQMQCFIRKMLKSSFCYETILIQKEERKKRNKKGEDKKIITGKFYPSFPGDIVVDWAFCSVFWRIERNSKRKENSGTLLSLLTSLIIYQENYLSSFAQAYLTTELSHIS